MDNLKLIDKTEEELQTQTQAVRTIIHYIHAESGPEKRAKFVLKRGKLFH
jgi:hypothetical protein